MSGGAANALAPLLLEHPDLRTALFALDHREHPRIRNVGRTSEPLAAVFLHQQHFVERQLRAGVAGRAVDDSHATGGDPDLSSARLNYCVHVRHLCKRESLAPLAAASSEV